MRYYLDVILEVAADFFSSVEDVTRTHEHRKYYQHQGRHEMIHDVYYVVTNVIPRCTNVSGILAGNSPDKNRPPAMWAKRWLRSQDLQQKAHPHDSSNEKYGQGYTTSESVSGLHTLWPYSLRNDSKPPLRRITLVVGTPRKCETTACIVEPFRDPSWL
jgi:hypothetical protein